LSSNRGVAPSPSDLLIAVLRDGAIPEDSLQSAAAGTLLELAREHGVVPMVADRLAARPDVPGALLQTFRAEAHRAAAVDLIQEGELRRVLARLASASIAPVVIKGSQLAYSHYRRSDLRPRLDTDLMIAASDRQRAGDILQSLGYEVAGQVSGQLVMSQSCYVRRQQGTILHAVDLHWKMANPQVFADVLTFDEMARAAVALPRLSPIARGLCDVHALLVACIHRVAHHFDAMRLIWLYDVHLLAGRLDRRLWREAVALAADRGVAAVVRQSLARTQQVFGSTIPADVLAALGAAAATRAEASAAYVSLTPRSRSQVRVLISDLRALASWRDRWRLLQEHVFPPVRYMRDVYAPSSRAPVSILYVRRAVRGARKWLVRT